MLPFAKVYDPAAPVAVEGVSTCATPNVNARVLKAAPLNYPEVAKQMRVAGRIQLKVTLNEDGFVSSVTVYKRSVPEGAGGDSLVDESIYAAGASWYAPTLTNCNPNGGSYIFSANFTSR